MSTYAPQESQDVVKSFKKRKLLFQVLWYAGCFTLLIGVLSLRNPEFNFFLPKNIEPYVFFGITLVLFVGAIFTFRCPVCRNFFWINTRTIACNKCKTVFIPESKRPFW